MACAAFSLTVSASKRLIAKGVAQLPCIRRALERGTIAIAKGTTNGYVVEEILGRSIDKTQYITGTTQPRVRPKAMSDERLPDVILRDGVELEGVSVVEIAGELREGDVLVKGANALSADRKTAGVLIGDPHGGTVGATLGQTYGSFVTRVIPAGLEKVISGDVMGAARALDDADGAQARWGNTPSLWPVHGTIVTEIEALELLAGVTVTQIGAGGINGAEGAVWLLADGADDEVERARQLIDSISGEPPFVE